MIRPPLMTRLGKPLPLQLESPGLLREGNLATLGSLGLLEFIHRVHAIRASHDSISITLVARQANC